MHRGFLKNIKEFYENSWKPEWIVKKLKNFWNTQANLMRQVVLLVFAMHAAPKKPASEKKCLKTFRTDGKMGIYSCGT